jgi:hypothetical protein
MELECYMLTTLWPALVDIFFCLPSLGLAQA